MEKIDGRVEYNLQEQLDMLREVYSPEAEVLLLNEIKPETGIPWSDWFLRACEEGVVFVRTEYNTYAHTRFLKEDGKHTRICFSSQWPEQNAKKMKLGEVELIIAGQKEFEF